MQSDRGGVQSDRGGVQADRGGVQADRGGVQVLCLGTPRAAAAPAISDDGRGKDRGRVAASNSRVCTMTPMFEDAHCEGVNAAVGFRVGCHFQ